jgi:hypothetical protein
MHPRQQVLALWLMSLHLPIVGVARQTQIGVPPIGANRTARFDRLPDKAMQALATGVGDATQSHSPDALAVFLGRYGDQGLVLRLPTDNTLFRAAPVRFIDLYNTGEPVPPRPHHGPT